MSDRRRPASELPPKHALVGLNGDVLRGEIEAMSTTHFGFRSGLETLRVPRARVKAIIWLQPAASTPAAAPAPAAEEQLPELSQAITLQTEDAVKYDVLVRIIDSCIGSELPAISVSPAAG